MLKGELEEADWPHRALSDFIDVGDVHWHVQRKTADGPRVLFIHGSGASTHSWAGLIECLPEDVAWIAVDLPGHGFTEMTRGRQPSGPSGIAEALGALLEDVDVDPDVVVGHSAGAAIGLLLARDRSRRGVLALNPSLSDALEGRFERAVAELIGPVVRSTGAARLLAGLAESTGLVDTLLDRTGSDVPGWSRACYRRLLSDPDRVAGVLRMFSEWRARDAVAAMPAVRARVTAVVGSVDRWIREADVRDAVAALGGPHELVVLEGGHLLHEERPSAVVEPLQRLLSSVGA